MTQREGVGSGQEPTPEIQKCTSEHFNNSPEASWQASPSSGRVYCRNPKCRSKLKIPISNPREAFCTRSCWQQFHRHRCLVCEREMPRNAEHQRTCYRAQCKTAWRLKTIQSHFLGWK